MAHKSSSCMAKSYKIAFYDTWNAKVRSLIVRNLMQHSHVFPWITLNVWCFKIHLFTVINITVCFMVKKQLLSLGCKKKTTANSATLPSPLVGFSEHGAQTPKSHGFKPQFLFVQVVSTQLFMVCRYMLFFDYWGPHWHPINIKSQSPLSDIMFYHFFYIWILDPMIFP